MSIEYRARPFTSMDAHEIAHWRYPTPYDIYDSTPVTASVELLVATAAYYADPLHNYFAVDDEKGELLGFGCWGVEAQVAGYDYGALDALDIGFGMRPDRVGQGRGQPFLTAILAYTQLSHRSTNGPVRVRSTVASFNERSACTFRRAGFEHIASFRSTNKRPADFCVYTRWIE